jgi:hypothetical protein
MGFVSVMHAFFLYAPLSLFFISLPRGLINTAINQGVLKRASKEEEPLGQVATMAWHAQRRS